jgi:hypothetical protein
MQAVLQGAVPSSFMIRRIAPTFGLHVADLFVMAGLVVPDDLAPWDAKAGSAVRQLVRYAIRLNLEQRRRLRQYVESLPQPDGRRQVPVVPAYEQYEPSVAAMVVSMLRNRNLDWSASAEILFSLAGTGPLSASTVGAIGHGRVELSRELLVSFGTVLAIPVDDLAALAGIELAHGTPPVDPAATDVAELIWDVRRLDLGQVEQVRDAAKTEAESVA